MADNPSSTPSKPQKIKHKPQLQDALRANLLRRKQQPKPGLHRPGGKGA